MSQKLAFFVAPNIRSDDVYQNRAQKCRNLTILKDHFLLPTVSKTPFYTENPSLNKAIWNLILSIFEHIFDAFLHDFLIVFGARSKLIWHTEKRDTHRIQTTQKWSESELISYFEKLIPLNIMAVSLQK